MASNSNNLAAATGRSQFGKKYRRGPVRSDSDWYLRSGGAAKHGIWYVKGRAPSDIHELDEVQVIDRVRWYFKPQPTDLSNFSSRSGIALLGQFDDDVLGEAARIAKVIARSLSEIPVTPGYQAAPAEQPVPARFRGSEKLMGYWQRGIKSHVEELSDVQLPAAAKVAINSDDIGLESLAEEFTVLIEGLFSTLGFRNVHGLEVSTIMSQNGKFALALQYQLLDLVPIRPDETTEFLALLYEELIRFSQQGGRIGGAGGALIYDKGELKLYVNSEAKRKPGSRRPAKVISE